MVSFPITYFTVLGNCRPSNHLNMYFSSAIIHPQFSGFKNVGIFLCAFLYIVVMNHNLNRCCVNSEWQGSNDEASKLCNFIFSNGSSKSFTFYAFQK